MRTGIGNATSFMDTHFMFEEIIMRKLVAQANEAILVNEHYEIDQCIAALTVVPKIVGLDF